MKLAGSSFFGPARDHSCRHVHPAPGTCATSGPTNGCPTANPYSTHIIDPYEGLAAPDPSGMPHRSLGSSASAAGTRRAGLLLADAARHRGHLHAVAERRLLLQPGSRRRSRRHAEDCARCPRARIHVATASSTPASAQPSTSRECPRGIPIRASRIGRPPPTRVQCPSASSARSMSTATSTHGMPRSVTRSSCRTTSRESSPRHHGIRRRHHHDRCATTSAHDCRGNAARRDAGSALLDAARTHHCERRSAAVLLVGVRTAERVAHRSGHRGHLGNAERELGRWERSSFTVTATDDFDVAGPPRTFQIRIISAPVVNTVIPKPTWPGLDRQRDDQRQQLLLGATVSFSGTGVTVNGSPSVNGAGTQIELGQHQHRRLPAQRGRAMSPSPTPTERARPRTTPSP